MVSLALAANDAPSDAAAWDGGTAVRSGALKRASERRAVVAAACFSSMGLVDACKVASLAILDETEVEVAGDTNAVALARQAVPMMTVGRIRTILVFF